MAVASYMNFDSNFFNKYATLDYYLSRGASGNVHGPISWHDMQLAIKQVMFSDGKVTDKFTKDLEVKKAIWTSLEHRHLMRIHSVDLNRLPKAMFIVMEFAVGGSLNKTLRSLGSENKLPIDVVTEWAKQIAEGMLYLHQKNIVHRDLKSSNILLMEPFDIRNSRTMITLKIADFDDVKEHDHTTTMASLVGTGAYMAPEVLQNQWFSKASDVWSYGVVTWEMLSGDIPHKGLEPTTIMAMSLAGTLEKLPLEQSFPDDYKLLLERCWQSTWKERPSFDEIFFVLQRMVSDEAAAENDDSIRGETNTDDEDVTNKQSQNDRYVLDEFHEPQTRLPKGRELCGLAILDQEVFILRLQRSGIIEVYDSRKFHLKRRMEVQQATYDFRSVEMYMTDPEDIVSCSVNKCLYVSDRGPNSQRPSIIRINPTTGNLIKSWVTSNGSGRCISIASDTNVILSIINRALLHEYTADGHLIREITCTRGPGFGHHLPEARHAIKLPNGLFVVCHGAYGDYVRGVCLLSTKKATRDEGRRIDEVEILKEFYFSWKTESVDSLQQPRYLSVDKEGSVLVLDGSNIRAVLLSSNLDKPQKIISEKDGMNTLRRTCFDESTGQWFVADDHHVMVCQVKGKKVERKRYSLSGH